MEIRKKMEKIIKKVGTKSQRENYDNPDVHRAFRRDVQKAKNIIKNVEKGFFPG